MQFNTSTLTPWYKLRIRGYDPDEKMLIQFNGKHCTVPVTVSTNSREYRDPNQVLFYLKSPFSEKETSPFI